MRNLLLALAAVVLVAVPPAFAQEEEPVVDLMEFIPDQFRTDVADLMDVIAFVRTING